MEGILIFSEHPPGVHLSQLKQYVDPKEWQERCQPGWHRWVADDQNGPLCLALVQVSESEGAAGLARWLGGGVWTQEKS